MAARKAAVHVTVGDRSYAPGDEIPAEVADLVDNPAVWGDDAEDKKPARKSAASK